MQNPLIFFSCFGIAPAPGSLTSSPLPDIWALKEASTKYLNDCN